MEMHRDPFVSHYLPTGCISIKPDSVVIVVFLHEKYQFTTRGKI